MSLHVHPQVCVATSLHAHVHEGWQRAWQEPTPMLVHCSWGRAAGLSVHFYQLAGRSVASKISQGYELPKIGDTKPELGNLG